MKWPLGFTLIVHGYQSKWGVVLSLWIRVVTRRSLLPSYAKSFMCCPLWIQLDFWKKFQTWFFKKQVQMDSVRRRLDGLVVKRYVLDLKFFVQKLLFYYLGLSLILNNGARERMQSCVKHYQARDGENQ